MAPGLNGEREWDTGTVLAYAWAVVEEYGWASKGVTARGLRMSTSDRVRLAMSIGLLEQDDEARTAITDRIGPHLERGRRMAPQITAALLAQLGDATGYEAELAALLQAATVRDSKLGLAVSAVSVYHRLAERGLAAEQETARRHNQAARIRRVGKVGQKTTLTGQVVTTIKIDGFTRDSGPQMMLVLDCGTSVAKIVTTAGWAYTVHAGDTLTVEATVKARHSYLGLPQTRLARPKLIDGPDPAAPTAAAPSPNEAPTSAWETVRPLPPQARFQEAPLAVASPNPGRLPS